MLTSKAYCTIYIALFAFGTTLAQDLTLDEILKKEQQAIGGNDVINKIQTLKITSRQLLANGKAEILTITSIKRPGQMRSETTMQGNTLVAACDGSTGWTVNPLTGSSAPQRTDDKMKAKAAGVTVDSTVAALSNLKALGNTVELIGQDTAAAVLTYKIKVTFKNGETSTYFIDGRTFLPVRMISNLAPLGNMVCESTVSDYRNIEGLLFAHKIEGQLLGQQTTINYEKVEINIPMDDSIFKFPAMETTIKK